VSNKKKARRNVNKRPAGAKHSRLFARNPHGFRKREYPRELERGLFTVLLDDSHGKHVAQVWASTPGSAASMMAPWAKSRLRRARRHEEVPVELLGWNDTTAEELSKETGIPVDEIDPGCLGSELCHVWEAEQDSEENTATLCVIETIAYDQGIIDDPWC